MNLKTDILIIGAGPAGLGAGIGAKKAGAKRVLVLDRETTSGGVLFQCIHAGFGIHRYGEELTGPEYAERIIAEAGANSVEILTRTAVLEITEVSGGYTVVALSEKDGLLCIETRAIILAMGCRERNRGNLNIPGTRGAGIMTAGLAQRLVNCEGLLPGKEVVILGSGDIGMIMARRLSLEGVYVKAVVEIQPFCGGLARNVVGCLRDFHIPLYLSHTVTNISGEQRITGVEISPIGDSREPKNEGIFQLGCDCLLLSVGLIPENELSIQAGVSIDAVTNGPVVDARLMTSRPGIFACGNVLHVHDVVDFVSEEGETAGKNAAAFIAGPMTTGCTITVRAGNLVRYALPSRITPTQPATLCLRPIAPVENATLFVKADEKILYRQQFKKILPGSMIRFSTETFQTALETMGKPVLELFFSKEKP